MPRTAAPWETKRSALVKAEGKTDLSFGCKPEDRSAEDYLRYGVINLDKPAGPTSHEVAAWVKRILKLQQVGHGGTLEARKAREIPKSPVFCQSRLARPRGSFRPFYTAEKSTYA